jgi:hypothetical protein
VGAAEVENAKLKRLVANLSLDKITLQDVLKKSDEALPAAFQCQVTTQVTANDGTLVRVETRRTPK